MGNQHASPRGGGQSRLVVAIAAAACAAFADLSGQTLSAPVRFRVLADAEPPPELSLSIRPSVLTLQAGHTQQFSVDAIPAASGHVHWSATGGTITNAGAFTAGAVPGTFEVTGSSSGIRVAARVIVVAAQPAHDRAISSADNFQAAITGSPEGTVFLVKQGVHRLVVPLVPRNRQTFIGEPGAVLSGARRLTQFSRSGAHWIATGQSQAGEVHGQCRPERPRCSRPEDVYLNDALLRHVATLADVGPGRWHFDYPNDRIVIGDDPSGKTVETTVVRQAFGGRAADVTISSLMIEKFANPAQVGAVAGDSGTGWLVQGNEIRFTHGLGLRIGPRMRALDNHIHHNGQSGIGGTGDDVLVEGNRIDHNNTAGHDPGWEAGGTKFVLTNRLVVRNNVVHHNDGSGLWTDIENFDTLYENNLVEDNTQMGIFHEISYAATIRGNTVRRNALASGDWWLYGAGILVSASRDVEVYGNLVEGNHNGITAVMQERGTGRLGVHRVENLHVHDNVVRASGLSGLAQDIGDLSFFTGRNNRFVSNTYYPGAVPRPFAWMNRELTEAEWQGFGNDVTGRVVR